MLARRQYHELAGALATDGPDPATVWEVASRITDYLTTEEREGLNV